ncbi:hypothetical protein T01_7578 [Trichinella spiralis]|uniref:Uncharacterized protein n=1 Tax=Trichinella spiralis TaxID=6334 RepID=A0A0V1BNX6_TRISP|nr:hypothetical protein T01_7578 [Trichinella spiralis]
MDKRCGVQIKAALSASGESNLSSENALGKWTDGQTDGQSGVQPKLILQITAPQMFKRNMKQQVQSKDKVYAYVSKLYSRSLHAASIAMVIDNKKAMPNLLSCLSLACLVKE